MDCIQDALFEPAARSYHRDEVDGQVAKCGMRPAAPFIKGMNGTSH
jgi:hypothetical protein